MIIITHSLFNAGLARLPSPEIYISAFAVAKSLMHIIQSPVMNIRQTVTALAADKDSYFKVRKFITIILIVIVTVFFLLVVTGMSRWILDNIMGLEGRVLNVAENILKVLILFPAVIAIRSFAQGVCIKFGATPLVTVATAARISFVFIVVANIGKITNIPGGYIAGGMFLGAAFVEALVMFIGSRLVIGTPVKKFNHMDDDKDKKVKGIALENITVFFLPLAFTALIRKIAIPVINSGLARTISPEISLSVFAVGWGLGAIFLSPLMMFHQVPLYFIEHNNKQRVKQIRNFSIYTGVLLSISLSLLAFTDAGFFILKNLIGTTEEISLLAMDVLKVMAALPIIMVSREFYWGVLMKNQKTKYIGKGKTVNIISIIVTVLVMSFLPLKNPAISGVCAMFFGELFELAYLYLNFRRTDLSADIQE